MIHFRAMVFTSILLFSFVFISFGYLSQSLPNQAGADYGKELSNIMTVVSTNYVDEMPLNKAFSEAAKAIIERDEFSRFLPGRSAEKFEDKISGLEVQVGIQYYYKPGYLEVVSVDSGSSVVASLAPKDRIVAVAGEEIAYLTRKEVSRKLSGGVGSSVVIKVSRPGQDGFFELTAVRKRIEKDPIFLPHFLAQYPHIMYIYLDFFHDKSSYYFKEVYEKLRLQNPNAKGLIFDLRGNPGGALNSALDFADLFLKEGLIVATIGNEEGHRNQIEESLAKPGDEIKLLPMVILIDRESASASELITGCLRDHGLATVIGENSFGKGSAQSLFSFYSKVVGPYGFKLTTARFYTKAGYEARPRVSIHGVGVKPDIYFDFGGQDEYHARIEKFQFAIGEWNYKFANKASEAEVVKGLSYFNDLENNDGAILKAISVLEGGVK